MQHTIKCKNNVKLKLHTNKNFYVQTYIFVCNLLTKGYSMGIDLITAMKLPKQQPVLTTQTLPQATTTSTNQQTTATKKDIKETLKKNSPYIAGAILLAGLGFYAMHNKEKAKKIIKDNVGDKIIDDSKKVKDEIDEIVDIILKKTSEKKHSKDKITIITDKNRLIPPTPGKLKKLDEILNPNKGIKIKLPENIFAPKTEKTTQSTASEIVETTTKTKNLKRISKKTIKKVVDKFEQQKKSLKLNDEAIVKKITDNRTKQTEDINRIIGENTRDGQIDINVMKKVANDFADDAKGRGKDRFHQAADLLEQTYIRTFIKGDANEKLGLKEFAKALFSDKDLAAIYKKMTKSEVANRLNYLKENDLKSLSYKEMSAEEFLEIGLKKVLEKFGKKTQK